MVAGCLLRGEAVRGGHKDKYVIADVKRGPLASVTEAGCTADPGADALELDHGVKGTVSDAMVGRWVEINGSLEKETSKNPDNLRELDVVGIKEIPVVVPRAAAPPTAPSPTPAVEEPIARAPEPEPQPVATTGQADTPAPAVELPKTASPAPLLGLLGLLSLVSGFAMARRRS